MTVKFNKSRIGFTLIEVLLVITLMAVITFANPISVSFQKKIKMRSTVNRIVSDLRYARILSLIKKRTYRFRIYRNDDLYKIDSDSDSDYIIYYTDDSNDICVVKEGWFPGQYRLYKNLNPSLCTDDYYDRVRFMPHGTALGGTIGLKDGDGEILKIIISQLGRVRIE